MALALTLARSILAPALLLIAAWFFALRRARPDLASRWLTAKIVALLLSIALAAVASAIGSPATALACVAVADVVAWFLAVRLWVERRPRALTGEEAAREARRLADSAIDLTATAERQAKDVGGRRG